MCSTREVGYQNKAVVDESVGGNSFILNTLPAVNADMETLTLGEFRVTPPAGGLVSTTSVNLFTLDDAGQIEDNYVYLDEVTSGDFGCDPGWYTAQSVEDWEPVEAASAKIAFGRGVMILSDCGATITFAGQVCKIALSFEIVGEDVGGNTFTGNCSPVEVKLKDIAITSPDGGLVSTTSVNVFTLDDAGQIEDNYVYLDEVTSGDFGCDPGWYTAQSVEDWEPVSAGDKGIAAGRVLMILSDCGATITIPSAL